MSVPWEIEITNKGWRTIKGSPPPIDHATITRIQKWLDTAGPIETYADYVSLHSGEAAQQELTGVMEPSGEAFDGSGI